MGLWIIEKVLKWNLVGDRQFLRPKTDTQGNGFRVEGMRDHCSTKLSL
jgi:hypothetical protein